MPAQTPLASHLRLSVLRRYPLLTAASLILWTTLLAVPALRLAAGLAPELPQTTKQRGLPAAIAPEAAEDLALRALADRVEQPRAGVDFTIACPPPYQSLQPEGRLLWACRDPSPSPDDAFQPSCVLTAEPVAENTSAQAYVQAAAARSPLSADASWRKTATRAVGRELAFELSYVHHLLGSPLHVMATSLVQGERAWTVTCTATPDQFAERQRDFRAITNTLRAER